MVVFLLLQASIPYFQTAIIMEDNTKENQPKPVVTKGNATLGMKMNLCYVKRLTTLMTANIVEMQKLLGDSNNEKPNITKLREARKTSKLLHKCSTQSTNFVTDCMRKSTCLNYSKWYISEMESKENENAKRKRILVGQSSNSKRQKIDSYQRLQDFSLSLLICPKMATATASTVTPSKKHLM